MSGNGDPVLGYMKDKRLAIAFAVAITKDDSLLFASQGETSWVSIIDLQKARTQGFSTSAIVGGFPIGDPTMGLALSPDERYLYLNSTDAPNSGNWPLTCVPSQLGSNNLVGPNAGTQARRDGGIVAIDLQLAESGSSNPVIGSTRSGCGANRLALSPDGDQAYVTLTADNSVVAFDLRPVKTGAAPALIGRVPTGPAPVDIVLVDGGKKIVVAISNQAARKPNDRETLNVIDAARVSEGPRAILGTIPAGGDPRNLRVTADGRALLVTNQASGTLEIIDLERLQLEPVKK
jgi:DNA-binding beta-propeller fold protein YncE